MMRLIATLFLLAVLIGSVAAQSASPRSASDILAESYKHAQASDRNVFLMFHASWCSWCKRLDAVLSDSSVQKIFQSHYVITHLDVLERKEKKETLENPGGVEVMKELGGADSGLPFYAILDAKGKLLVNSNALPKNQNIGFPAAKEEVEAFMTMIKKTAKRLTDAESTAIIQALAAHAPKPRPATN